MRYRLLGPLAVERDGEYVDLGPPQQRAVLAVLAQEAGAVVSTDRLLASVWGEDHAPGVVSSLHAHISRLRRALRDGPATTPPVLRRAAGYVLDIDPGEVDVARFLAAAGATRRAVDERDWAGAVAAGEEALAWWRGSYLDDFRDAPWARVAEVPLLERRAGVQEDVVVGLLGLDDLAAALARSQVMVLDRPLVERAAWLHTVALNRAGRPGDALAACRAHAAALADELGLDAGPAMRDLESAVLRGDPVLATWPGSARASLVPGVVEPAAGPARVAGPTVAEDPAGRLVGRDAEIAVVDEVLDSAREHATGWLVLGGPAGIGKTRLAREAIRRWGRAGGRAVQVQCPDDDLPAWWPVRQVLRQFGLDADGLVTEPADGDADAARFAVGERTRDAVVDRLVDGPLLLVVDDVQWADRASLRWLTFVAESVDRRGLALVLTVRDGVSRPELDRLLAAVARCRGSRLLTVPPLSAEDVGALAEQVGGDRLDPVETAELARRTGGNPFFVGEYARLDPDQRRSRAVPGAVRSVLRQRLAGLPDGVLDVLRAAAVLGDPLDVQMLAGVLRRDPDDVADLLDEAADQDVLTPATSGGAYAYAFAHALLREEVAAGVPVMRRQRLHLRAAAATADGVRSGDAVVRRAAHLRAAGTLAGPADVFAAVHAAALAAEGQGHPDGAARWWGEAVAAHERLAHVDADRHDELVRSQVAALTRAGRGQSVLDVLDAALLEAMRAGRTTSVGRLAANLLRVSGSWPWPAFGSDPAPLIATLRGLEPLLVTDVGARARVLAVSAIGHCYDPDPAVPDGLSRRAIELAESIDDAEVLADALLGRAMTFSGVAERSAESITLLQRLDGLPHGTASVDAVLRHSLLTMARLNLGEIDAVVEHVEAGAVGADLLRRPVDRVQLRWAEAAVAQWRGDLRRAEQLYARAAAAHRRTELQQSGTFELAELILRWDQGRLDEIDGRVPTNPQVAAWTTVVAAAAAGASGIDAALAAEVRRPEPTIWTSHGRLTLLAHAVADRGLVDLAGPLADRLQPLAGYLGAIGQIGVVGPVALASARLARLGGDAVAAREHLDRARALARDQGGISAELHCRLLAVEWALDDRSGHPTGAERSELTDVRDGAQLRGMTGVVRRAQALLSRS